MNDQKEMPSRSILLHNNDNDIIRVSLNEQGDLVLQPQNPGQKEMLFTSKAAHKLVAFIDKIYPKQ